MPLPKLRKIKQKSSVALPAKQVKKEEHKWNFKKVPKALMYLRPAFELGSKGKRITATPMRVTDPKQFDGAFKKGDKILYIHFEATNPRSAIELFKTFESSLKSKEFIDHLTSGGYSGFCGDTPNDKIAKLFVKHGGKKVAGKISTFIQRREQARYLLNTVVKKYPASYFKGPIQRIIFKF